jgi:site-specific DNA-methyltransferase (adenine-specific)
MKTTTIRRDRGWERLKPFGYCRSPAVGIGEPTRPVELPRNTVLLGDAAETLRSLPQHSIDACVTSPPYFALRDYGVEGQIGLEPDVDAWVVDLCTVFDEVARVLKPAGSLWLNLGDSFSRHTRYGAPAKSMLCAPERLLLALVDQGWICRGKIIWSKPNALPSSVADRPNLTHEYLYFLVRSPRYFFDLDAIREPHRSRAAHKERPSIGRAPAWAGPLAGSQDGLRRARPGGQPGHPLGKTPGSVWEIATRGFRGPHFATFPPDLIRRPILATAPEAICTRCGAPWRRPVSVERIPLGPPSKTPIPLDKHVMRFKNRWHTVRHVGELMPCGCRAPAVAGTVLDPFMGAGTVGLVAESLRRDWIGVEISDSFRKLAIDRIEKARSPS